MIQKAIQTAENNFRRSVEDLKTLVSFPSVSFPGFDPAKVRRCAEAVSKLLKERGLEHIRLLEIPGAHPYVYGDWLHAPGAPTLLLYAHYDVQPPGRDECWKSPAFVPTERRGRLFGRGAADDKSGIVVHTSALSAWLESSGKLPLNVKVLFEGEEEIGPHHLDIFLKRYKSMLKADAMVLTDTGNFDTGIPSITTMLRGIVAMDVTVRTADHPLHSGMWGGPLPDPVQALAKMLASLSDRDGFIAVPGIYDGIVKPTRAEAESLRSLAYSEKELRKQSGLLPGVDVIGGKALPLEKMWRLPSVAVNAIQASSRKECANIICESAWCRVGVRLVPGMDPDRVAKLVKKYLLKHVPWGAKAEFTGVQGSPAWSTKSDTPLFDAARRALTLGYGRETVFTGCGGSIPFVEPFSEALHGAPALLIGVEDPYSNAHSENESLDLEDFRKAILGVTHLYGELSKIKF